MATKKAKKEIVVDEVVDNTITEVISEPQKEEVAIVTEENKEYEFKKEFEGATLYMDSLPKEELSMGERILNFIDSRNDGEIKLNDFLKSLYPLPKLGEPALYLRQDKAKELKGALTGLEKGGKVTFVGNGHTKLGKFYYEGNDTVTKYHNILTTQIVVKK